jgi:hypothetical protein
LRRRRGHAARRSDHEQSLAALQSCLVAQKVKCGRPPEADRCRFREIQVLGDLQHTVVLGYHHVLGVSAHTRPAKREHAIARTEAPNLLAHRLDHAR